MVRNILVAGATVLALSTLGSTRVAAAPAAAQQPSFSCSAARSFAERAVCSDPELARLDRITAELFTETRSLLLNAEQTANAAADQRAWLAARNRCANTLCVRSAYLKTIANLARELPEN